MGVGALWAATVGYAASIDIGFAGVLLALTAVSFIQNMSFTLVSRSRQSGDPERHRYAAWGSNFIWLATQAFIAANIYTPITNMTNAGQWSVNDMTYILLTFIVYGLSTAEGSVFMMRMNLGRVKLGAFSRAFTETKHKSRPGSR